MMDLLFQIGLSNVIISLVLAMVALVVEATTRRPQIAHLLWLLVIVKLLIPSFVEVPLGFIPGQADTALAAVESVSQQGQFLPGASEQTTLAVASQSSWQWLRLSSFLSSIQPWLAASWLLGSIIVLCCSLRRVYLFDRMLHNDMKPVSAELLATANGIAQRLGLKVVPDIQTTSARLSPLVWWTGGRVHIVLPETLLAQLDPGKSEWVVAHELAHVRRKDHYVRWIEWLACVCFWWNPLVWWARHHLRANEELSCDALVISTLQPEPYAYADSLLSAIECLAFPLIRPPEIASEINSGGIIERRLKMIISKSPTSYLSNWMIGFALLCVMVVLPIRFGGSGNGLANHANAAPGNDKKCAESTSQEIKLNDDIHTNDVATSGWYVEFESGDSDWTSDTTDSGWYVGLGSDGGAYTSDVAGSGWYEELGTGSSGYTSDVVGSGWYVELGSGSSGYTSDTTDSGWYVELGSGSSGYTSDTTDSGWYVELGSDGGAYTSDVAGSGIYTSDIVSSGWTVSEGEVPAKDTPDKQSPKRGNSNRPR